MFFIFLSILEMLIEFDRVESLSESKIFEWVFWVK